MKATTSLPGIYLPLNNCDAIAKHLPVVWRPDIEYYAWNTSDDRFRRIISSPGFLAFVLSDRLARNITVKVPFLLLNLTMEPPFTKTPVSYFPCRPSQFNATILGRAFLQSAFLGLNYDTSMAYLAQASGPNVGQLVSTQFPQNATETFQAEPSSLFANSWASRCTPLTEASPSASGNSSHSLSPGAIAEIVVGCLAALVTVGAAIWMVWRRKKTLVTEPTGSQSVTATRELHAESVKIQELGVSKVNIRDSTRRESAVSELPAL